MKEGELIWYKNAVFTTGKAVPAAKRLDPLWVKGVVKDSVASADGGATVSVVDGPSFKIALGDEESDFVKFRNSEELSPTNSTSTDDLITLPVLNEPEILHHVRERYERKTIYTLTGPLLIAVNPMIAKSSPKSDGILTKYGEKVRQEACLSGNNAMDDDLIVTTSQETLPTSSILVSGESGSGKTECVRKIMSTLLTGSDEVLENLKTARSILEAFGNAKTSESLNSSRYGQYLDLFFNADNVAIGGKIRTYLMEVVRVVNQMSNERGFHVFYQLITGAEGEDRKRWMLEGVTSDNMNYTKKGKSNSNGLDDSESYNKLQNYFTNVGQSTESFKTVMDLVAGVIQFGQIEFKGVELTEFSGEGAAVKDMDHLVGVAKLCGFDVKELENTLCFKTIISPRGEKFTKNLSPSNALNVRDGIAKAIYERLYSWIVNMVNGFISPPDGESKSFGVSILDIYGFDAFLKNNSFEQLCINYVNEALQQQFNQQIFKMEITEYESEGIDLKSISFQDNQDSLDLIGIGIFRLLDDQCKIPNPTDSRLAQAMYKEFGAIQSTSSSNIRGAIQPTKSSMKLSICEKFSATRAQQVALQFCVNHFAGPVVYSVNTFIEKNMDELPQDANVLIQGSENAILPSTVDKATTLSGLLEKMNLTPIKRVSVTPSPATPVATAKASEDPTKDQGQAGSVARKISGYTPPTKSVNTTPSHGSKSKLVPSAATQFKNELSVLIKEINQTSPHYIRCIKPFDAGVDAEDGKFCEVRVAEQLLYSGVLEAVSVNRAVLPVKIPQVDFFARYKLLCTDSESKLFTMDEYDLEDNQKELNKYLDVVLQRIRGLPEVEEMTIQIGKTKVFMKKVVLEVIEAARREKIKSGELEKAVTLLQAEYRGYRVRKKMNKKRAEPKVEKLPSIPSSDPEPTVKVAEPEPEPAPVPPQSTQSKTSVTSEKTGRSTSYLQLRIAEFNKQDVLLLKAINDIITASKANDQINIVALDIDYSKQLLKEWAATCVPGLFQMKLEESVKSVDFGYKLLKSEKLIPKTVSSKLFNLGKKSTGFTQEERLKSAKSASKVITKEHKVFKSIYMTVDSIRELKQAAVGEQGANIKRMTRKEEDYHNAVKSAAEADKLSLKNLYEQDCTKMSRQIQQCKKVSDLCTSLEQYYLKYIILFVEEYGNHSKYKSSFADETQYILALTDLIEKAEPLLVAEKKAISSGVRKPVAKSSQELFPLSLPSGTGHMNMVVHQELKFNFMPFLPGDEYTLNSLYTLLLGRNSMYPIRFIKVMGRSKNNEGKVAYYQTCPAFTDTCLADIVSNKSEVEKIDMTHFAMMVINSILTGLTHLSPSNVMVNTSKGFVEFVGYQNDRFMSSGAVCFSNKEFSICDEDETVGKSFNCLYAMPQMDKPIGEKVAKLLTKKTLFAERIISSWLREFNMQNQRYQSLISSGFNMQDLNLLQLPIKLPSHTVTNVYEKLNAMCDKVTSGGASTTCNELLSMFYPKLNAYYEEVRGSEVNTNLGAKLDGLLVPLRGKQIDASFFMNKNKGAHILPTDECATLLQSKLDFSQMVCEESEGEKFSPYNIIGDNLSFIQVQHIHKVSAEQFQLMFSTVAKINTKQLFIINSSEESQIKETSAYKNLIGAKVEIIFKTN